MSVLEFKRKPKVVHPNDQYYCTRCDGDSFRLSAMGMAHCYRCGALMKNLLVTLSPQPNR